MVFDSAFLTPVAMAMPLPFLFSTMTFAPWSSAFFTVLSFDNPSITKTSVLMSSSLICFRVSTMPSSSFSVGIMMLTLVVMVKQQFLSLLGV